MDDFAQGYFRSAVVFDHKMWIFGGRNIHNYNFNDLYVYEFEGSNEIIPKDTYRVDFRSLLYGTSIVVPPGVYIILTSVPLRILSIAEPRL